jgi:hypothetical protein
MVWLPKWLAFRINPVPFLNENFVTTAANKIPAGSTVLMETPVPSFVAMDGCRCSDCLSGFEPAILRCHPFNLNLLDLSLAV